MDVDFPFTANVSHAGRRRPAYSRQPWDRARKDKLGELWCAAPKVPVEMIADELETSPGAVYQWAKKLGLPPRSRGGPRSSRKDTRFPDRAGDGLRRFTGVSPDSDRKVKLLPWHPALRNGTTIYGQLVIPAVNAPRLLKSGEHNRKIGSIAQRGAWKGAPIWTLTLIERETCPPTCLEWATCYGNNMGKAPRILVDEWFLRRLEVELAHLNAENPNGFIVRLHVLGDFYSVEYVNAWRGWLAQFPALRIFGFTARQPSDPIGRAVLEMMAENLARVCMRVSGAGQRYHCSEVVDKREDATGVVCPAEISEKVCCASCMVCQRSERTITFIRHGA